MIIVNADDFGRSSGETDVALACYYEGRITSASAMVFMKDSCRAAELGLACGIDVGLHLNLSESFSGGQAPQSLRDRHDAVVRFLTRTRYAQLLYNPCLRGHFQAVYDAQLEEFIRLYGHPPSHVDGHHHKHLCSNVLLGRVIPADEKVRRSFSYWPSEKSSLNRAYRRLVDWHLKRRYEITDFFFSLRECLETDRLGRVFELARSCNVELMTHPSKRVEHDYLVSDGCWRALSHVTLSTYRDFNR